MTDRYRYSSNSNWTQTDMKMTDRYMCNPKTETDKMMTDWYRCGPNLNWTQIDMKMADRHRCSPKNWNWQDDDWSIWVWSQKLKWQDEWQIDIGAVPTRTKHKLTGRWLIDISATLTRTEYKLIGRWSIDICVVSKIETQTDKMVIDRYRFDPNSNWTQIDMKMTDRYRCGPKLELNTNW